MAGNAGQANHAASKAGVIGLTKSIAREPAGRNITPQRRRPGFIETDMTDALPEKQRAAIGERIAAKRFGTAEEVAAGALPRERGLTTTGQVICIDGGMVVMSEQTAFKLEGRGSRRSFGIQ